MADCSNIRGQFDVQKLIFRDEIRISFWGLPFAWLHLQMEESRRIWGGNKQNTFFFMNLFCGIGPLIRFLSDIFFGSARG